MSPRRHSRSPKPYNRNGIWHLRRKVPTRFKLWETRNIVIQSTHIRVCDDPYGIQARTIIAYLDHALHQRWSALADGINPDASADYDRAVATARRHGYDYSPKTTLYTHDRLHEVIQRLEYLVANKQLHNKSVVASLMGIIEPPGLSLLDVVDTYQSIDETRLKDHSPNQLRKWRIQRDTCVRIFINVIGHNVPLNQLTRKHAAALHDYWKQLILRKEVQSKTANKSISMLRTMLVKINKSKKLYLTELLDDIYFAPEQHYE